MSSGSSLEQDLAFRSTLLRFVLVTGVSGEKTLQLLLLPVMPLWSPKQELTLRGVFRLVVRHVNAGLGTQNHCSVR